MIYSLFSSNRGAGSSTFTGIFANIIKEFNNKNLVIDLKETYSLDLILSFDQNIQLPFGGVGDIKNYIIQGEDKLDFLKINLNEFKKYTDYLYRLEHLKKELLHLNQNHYDNIIINFDKENIDLIEDISNYIFIIFTQDNISIRYLDEVISKKIKGDSVKKILLVLNKFKEVDNEILASLDEIYDIFENEFFSIIDYQEELRYYSNTSKLEFVNDKILQLIKIGISNILDNNIYDEDEEIHVDVDKNEDINEKDDTKISSNSELKSNNNNELKNKVLENKVLENKVLENKEIENNLGNNNYIDNVKEYKEEELIIDSNMDSKEGIIKKITTFFKVKK